MRIKVKSVKGKQKINWRWAWFLPFSRLIEFYFSADTLFSFRFPFPSHSILTAHLLVYTLISLFLYPCHQSLPITTFLGKPLFPFSSPLHPDTSICLACNASRLRVCPWYSRKHIKCSGLNHYIASISDFFLAKKGSECEIPFCSPVFSLITSSSPPYLHGFLSARLISLAFLVQLCSFHSCHPTLLPISWPDAKFSSYSSPWIQNLNVPSLFIHPRHCLDHIAFINTLVSFSNQEGHR